MVGCVQAMLMKPGAVAAGSLNVTPANSSQSLTTSQSYGQSFTANTSGMVGPITYLWEWQSGGAGFTLTGSASAVCNVTSPARANGASQSGVLRCTATDTGNGNKQYVDTSSIDVAWGTGV